MTTEKLPPYKPWKLVGDTAVDNNCPYSEKKIKDCKPELEIPKDGLSYLVRCYNCTDNK